MTTRNLCLALAALAPFALSHAAFAVDNNAAERAMDRAGEKVSETTNKARGTIKSWDDVSKATHEFAHNASIGGMFEVQSSKVAKDKATRQDVRDFANMMIKDHTKANLKLKALLPFSDADWEDLGKDLDAKHKDMLESLKQAEKGEAFDEAYIEAQAKAHEEAISLFDDYSKNGDDETLKNFATKTLPTLKMHQEHVKKLQAQTK